MRPTLPCAVFSAFLAGSIQAQAIVQSFAVPPSGTAFVGGLDYDPITDTIWTADETNNLMQQFTRTGTLVSSFAALIPPGSLITDPQPIGIGVDPATGNLWIGDEGEWVFEVTPSGVATGRSWPTVPAVIDVSGVAFSPATRTVFVSQDSGTRVVVEFSLTGQALRTIQIGAAGSTDADGLAFNPLTGTFYLGEDTGDAILEVDQNGALVQRFALVGLGVSPEGLGIDTRTGSIFVGDGFTTRRVYEISGVVAPCAGAVTPYGTACIDGGGGTPLLTATDCPTVGSYLGIVQATSASPGAISVLFFGTVRTSIPLTGLGAPSCSVYTNLVLILGAIPVQSRRAAVDLGLPNDPSLRGALARFHALNLLDTGANPGNLSTPNGLELLLQ